MSDLISRQEAIDVLEKILPADPMRNDYTEGITCGAALAMEYIKQLPSAKPERKTDGDTISRQAAINAIHEIEHIDCEGWELIDDIEECLKQLPSAQQWTPVSEGLPEITEHHVSEVVICYLADGAYCFGSLEENIFGQVGWSCERDDEYHQPVGEVLAWMPLPEPYKEDEL